MKLMYCQDCGGITVPRPMNLVAASCECSRHYVWWVDGARGILKLHDRINPKCGTPEGRMYPDKPRAYVIGITNALLRCDAQSLDEQTYQQIIDQHEDFYLFKRVRSCIIRIRPGETGDTSWGPLP